MVPNCGLTELTDVSTDTSRTSWRTRGKMLNRLRLNPTDYGKPQRQREMRHLEKSPSMRASSTTTMMIWSSRPCMARTGASLLRLIGLYRSMARQVPPMRQVYRNLQCLILQGGSAKRRLSIWHSRPMRMRSLYDRRSVRI